METNALDPTAASGPKRRGTKPAPAGSAARKPRDSLNRSVIIDAGLAIVKRDGLSGLTFQALGDELGAHATSVYRHFRDKDELLLEIIDTLRENSYGSDLVSTGDWRADLRLIATQIRDHYLRYAPFAHEMSLRSTHRKNEFENVEFALDALDRANLSREDAVLYLRLIGNYVRAMSSFDASVSCLDPELRAKDYLQMKSASMVLEKSEFPHLAEASLTLVAFDDPRIFELGLNAILDAIDARGKSGKQRTK
jgi:AcrR family transcriptional regulator